MIKNDFNWAAKNRARILDEWNKRYGTKSEPK
jgi:iron(III) transport system substrate-binding protein